MSVLMLTKKVWSFMSAVTNMAKVQDTWIQDTGYSVHASVLSSSIVTDHKWCVTGQR